VQESERGVSAAGLCVFGGASALIAVFKVVGVNDWSWWRVCLPIGSYVGFSLTHVATGFAYLSWIYFFRGRRSPSTTRIAVDQQRSYSTLGWIHFTLLAIGVSEWASPSQARNGFSRPFGSLGVMIAFASLAIISLLLFCSSAVEPLGE
jgi:hypothetical protein